MKEINYWQAIAEALAEEMERDETVFIIGENVQEAPFMATRELIQRFGPERVMDAPLSELAIAGATVGAACAGYRPVCDLNFADFIYCAADEILLKAAQQNFAHAGKVNAPCVFLGVAGGGFGTGPEHSHVPSAMVLNNPGLKLVLPSTPYDAKGLMKTAIRDNNPVCYFFHKKLMGLKQEIPEDEYLIPLGQADIKREGTDVTVVATLYMVHHALEAAKQLEGKISVEVIDPRSLEPLDMDTIIESIKKTNRVVVVDEDTQRCGVAAEIGQQIMELAFDYLDAPVARVCSANMPVAGAEMEKYCIPQVEQVVAAIQSVCY
ncbi:2-oxoisovalerate dehydrogenase subunit beta [Desulfosarcina cetonica]|uniref:alpha-ketoacid dehydrogenase subunit beta n=1 Tax=Desulfosarcina cetonica TaxID=90730 RepID=UPI0006D1F652|nr:transketolase C-terminal domain-containing protein [Desulfosarcina cetonica]VTR70460.1 2-oxoisovalerate dehydrogenase subunit beta [Desulfosarcina cetonica]